MRALWSYLRDERGNSAVEFAFVAPAFFVLVFAIINLSGVLYAYTQLHNATEDAARCYSISNGAAGATSSCYGATPAAAITATQTYATNHYKGPGVSPTFTASLTGPCLYDTANSKIVNNALQAAYIGHQVTATGSYKLNAVLVTVTIPLSTDACFP